MQTVPGHLQELIGTHLGLYRVQHLLAHGKLTAVFAGQVQDEQQEVLLTVVLLPDTFAADMRERFMERFYRMTESLTSLRHPSIVPVLATGEQSGYPYLVSPHIEARSLHTMLKDQQHYSLLQTLQILYQLAAAVDYAHQQQILHGSLQPSTVLIDENQRILVKNFGLVPLLEMRGLLENSSLPRSHLVSIGGSFLGSPAYTAPELVQGAPFGTGTDLYALGALVLELLTGTTPFASLLSSEEDPFEIALHICRQPVPSLKDLAPDLPPALDLVLQRALDRNPTERFTSADKMAQALKRTLEVLAGRQFSNDQLFPHSAPMATTLPPSTEHFAEELQAASRLGKPSEPAMPPATTITVAEASPITDTPMPVVLPENWQVKPPILTGKIPSVKPGAMHTTGKSLRQYAQPVTTDVTPPQQQMQVQAKPVVERKEAELEMDVEVDPLVWNSALTSTLANLEVPTLSPFNTPHPDQEQPIEALLTSLVPDPGRRRTVKLLAVGSVVTVGAVGLAGIGLSRILRGGGTKAQPPTRPSTHTTVIGNNRQQINTAQSFANPLDHKGSLLLHLSGGSFVAYESACTHEGVTVQYNPRTHMLECPLHHSVFDPAAGAKVLHGPAARPLKSVPIRVNTDGTITVG